MADKTAPPDEDNAMENDSQNVDELVDAVPDDRERNHQQKMFDETFSRLMDGFGKACEAEGVEIAVAIAQHPSSDRPMVFYRAPHIVDAGALMASLLREIKSDVVASLNTEPH